MNEGDSSLLDELQKHDENEHWWLVEAGKGQVRYVPVACMIIIDETRQEEESDTSRKDGHEKRTDVFVGQLCGEMYAIDGLHKIGSCTGRASARGPGQPAAHGPAGPGFYDIFRAGPGAGLKLAGPGRARAINFFSYQCSGHGPF